VRKGNACLNCWRRLFSARIAAAHLCSHASRAHVAVFARKGAALTRAASRALFHRSLWAAEEGGASPRSARPRGRGLALRANALLNRRKALRRTCMKKKTLRIIASRLPLSRACQRSALPPPQHKECAQTQNNITAQRRALRAASRCRALFSPRLNASLRAQRHNAQTADCAATNALLAGGWPRA